MLKPPQNLKKHAHTHAHTHITHTYICVLACINGFERWSKKVTQLLTSMFQESLVVVELTGIMEADLLPKVQECKVLVSFRKLFTKVELDSQTVSDSRM